MVNKATKQLRKIELQILPIQKDRIRFNGNIISVRNVCIMDTYQLQSAKQLIKHYCIKYLSNARTWNDFSYSINNCDMDISFHYDYITQNKPANFSKHNAVFVNGLHYRLVRTSDIKYIKRLLIYRLSSKSEYRFDNNIRLLLQYSGCSKQELHRLSKNVRIPFSILEQIHNHQYDVRKLSLNSAQKLQHFYIKTGIWNNIQDSVDYDNDLGVFPGLNDDSTNRKNSLKAKSLWTHRANVLKKGN